jgi:hypothetical protein
MGWSICLLENTVKISKKCAEALWDATVYHGTNENPYWDGKEYVTYKERLTFNADHWEHMDYVWQEEVLSVLLEYKVNGDITFGSLEGDNEGEFWGYRFKDGVKTELVGTIQWEEKKPKKSKKK